MFSFTRVALVTMSLHGDRNPIQDILPYNLELRFLTESVIVLRFQLGGSWDLPVATHTSNAGAPVIGSHTWLFTWVLGTHTQAPMLAQRALSHWAIASVPHSLVLIRTQIMVAKSPSS